MADWVLKRVSGMPAELEAKLAVMVVVAKDKEEEAWRFPAIWRLLEIVEEAEAIKPLPMVSIPVVEALAKLVFPETVSAVKVPTLVREEPMTAEPRAVADKVFAPLTARKFPEARFREPETYKVVVVALVEVEVMVVRLVIVEVPLFARIPPDKVESPAIFAVEATVRVEEADKGALTWREPAMVEEPTETKAAFKLERLLTAKVPKIVAEEEA